MWPVLPLSRLGGTPVPAINLLAADQVGWRRYVEQVSDVWSAVPTARRRRAAIITSNYGEAGAIARYGAQYGLPAPYSGHNGLFDYGPPRPGTTTVVFVGGQLGQARPLFRRCTIRSRLDNEVGVDNEEQAMPIALCQGPRRSWPDLWSRLRHLD